MLSKKNFFAFLLLSSLVHLQAKYFLEYKGKKIEITAAGLQQSKILEEIREEHRDDEKGDADYTTFHDQEGNFKIPLEPILEKITLPDGRFLVTVVDVDDIQNFAKLSTGVPVDLLDTQELIIQLNLADILGNKTILENVATALVKEINSKKELLAFLQGKGLIWTVINQLPEDILEYVLKKKLLKNGDVSQHKRMLELFEPFSFRDCFSWPIDFVWSPDFNQLAITYRVKCYYLLESGYDYYDYLRVWNSETNQFKTLTYGRNDIEKVSWSHDSKLLVTQIAGGYPRNRTIRIWNLKTNKSKILTTQEKKINQIAWSPNAHVLAFSFDGTLRICNIEAGTCRSFFSNLVSKKISQFAWSPNGKLIAYHFDDSIRFCNLETDICKTFFDQEKKIENIAWFPNGKIIIYKSGNTIRVCNTEGKTCTTLFSRKIIDQFELSPDGKLIAIACDKKFIQIYNLDTGREVQRLTPPEMTSSDQPRYIVKKILWSHDGKRLAAVSTASLRIWNTDTGSELQKIGISSRAKDLNIARLNEKQFVTVKKRNVITFFGLFDDVSFPQVVTMLALEKNALNKWMKTPDITKNKKIFEIMKMLPIDKITSIRTLGWIRISNKEIENIKKYKYPEKPKQQREEFLRKQREIWSQQKEERARIPELFLYLDRLSDPQKRFPFKKLLSVKQQTKNLIEKIKDPEQKNIAQKIEPKIVKALTRQAKSNVHELLGQLEEEKSQKISDAIAQQIKKLITFIKHLGDKRLSEKLEKPLSSIINQKLIFQAHDFILKLMKMLAMDPKNQKIKAKIIELINLIEILGGNKSSVRKLQQEFDRILKKKLFSSKDLKSLGLFRMRRGPEKLSAISNKKLILLSKERAEKLMTMLAKDPHNQKTRAKIIDLIKLIKTLGDKRMTKKLQIQFDRIVKKQGK